MTKDEAIKILSLHLMQCGMMMPVGWLKNHGEGSDFMKAYEMALDALKNEPVRCKDCESHSSNDAQITVYGADGCADSWIRTDSALMEKGERENDRTY